LSGFAKVARSFPLRALVPADNVHFMATRCREEKMSILGGDQQCTIDFDLDIMERFFGIFFPNPFSAVKKFMRALDNSLRKN
jgi:hypothetical protein